jgi:hypothetical protein
LRGREIQFSALRKYNIIFIIKIQNIGRRNKIWKEGIGCNQGRKKINTHKTKLSS